jgi:hypothetical protein
VKVGNINRLLLDITPLIYDTATQQATLVTDMLFRVDLPEQPALAVATEQLGTLAFDASTKRMRIGLPVLDSSFTPVNLSGKAVLAWTLNNNNGNVMLSDRVLLDIPEDKPDNPTLVYTIPQEYAPQALPTHAYLEVHLAFCERPMQSPSELEDWGGIAKNKNAQKTIKLIPYTPGEASEDTCPDEPKEALAPKDQQKLYFANDTNAEWLFCIKGTSDDISDSLKVSVDGTIMPTDALTLTREGSLYRYALPLSALANGPHVIRTEVQTDEGYDAYSQVIRLYENGLRIREYPELKDTHEYSDTTVTTMEGEWVVQVQDAQGNPVSGIPEEAFTVAVYGEPKPFRIEEHTEPDQTGVYTIFLTITQALIGESPVVISVETDQGVARFESSMHVHALGICQNGVCPPPAPTCAPAYSWETISAAQPDLLQRLTTLRQVCEYYPPDTSEHWYALALYPEQTVSISLTNIPEGANYDIMLYKADNLESYVAASSYAYHASEGIAYTLPDTGSGKQPYYLRVFLQTPSPTFDYYRLLVNDANHAVWLPHVAMPYEY